MSPRANLLIAERALDDIAVIEDYSVAKWGRRTASEYLADMESALVRIQTRPDLLRRDEELPSDLCFYRVRRHLMVFDRRPEVIVLLTVIHASRDIPARLAEMQPTLAAEVELLHKQLKRGSKRP